MAEKGRNVKGEIILETSTEVEWKTANDFLLSEAKVYFLESPPFLYLDGVWCLNCRVLPLAQKILISLMRVHSTSNHDITFKLGIKSKDGIEYRSQLRKSDFNKHGDKCGALFVVDWAYLQKDMVSFFCMFQSVFSKEAVSPTIRSEGASEYTEENAVNLIKKEDEGDDIKLEFTTKLGVNSLVQSFKDLLTREEQCDILVKVKDKEFKAHKLILGARSSVFSAMFAHDTSEKRTNIVEITDCEPDAFMQFLIYLYTGQVEKVPGDQVIDLYIIADKYNVGVLKEECVNFMKDHMTVEMFCDVMSLALSHNEMALIDSCTKYFVENVMKIIVKAQWITFVKKISRGI